MSFTFRASHHAYWAEEVAEEKSIPSELVPAPAQSPSKCGLALRTPIAHATDLEGVFQAEGIEFERWEG